MNPDELRQMAAELDEKARAAWRAGKEAEADAFVHAAWKARDLAEERERALSVLPRRVNKRTVNSVLSPDHRVAISKARAPAGNKLADYAQEAKVTMRDLAKGVGKSVALLSMAAAGKRTIKVEVAEQVQRLTRSKKHPGGFAATRANWPKLSE